MSQVQSMHPRILLLSAQLLPLTESPPARPTQADRDALMALREQIKDLPEDPGLTLSESDETDRQYLYMAATQEANRQEDFWEKNGESWAT